MIRAMLQLQDDELLLALFRFRGKCHITTVNGEEAGTLAHRLLTWCGRPSAAKDQIKRRDYPRDEMCVRCLERLQARCQEERQYRFYEKMTCDWCHEVISERHLLPNESRERVYDLCRQCHQEHPQRAAYRALLYRAQDLFKELTCESCICDRYDQRDPGVCFLCFHTPPVDEGQKVASVWHAWLEEAAQFLSEIEFLNGEERERVEVIKREAQALDRYYFPSISPQFL